MPGVQYLCFPYHFTKGGSVCGSMCAYTHKLHVRYSDVSPGVGTRHLESRNNLDRQKRCIHVTSQYKCKINCVIYAGLQDDFKFSHVFSQVLRKGKSVTTIRKLQSLTLVGIIE